MVTHQAGQQQAGRCFRAQTQVHKGQREGGVVTGIDQIAMQQHGGANTNGRACHSSNQRLGEICQRMQELEHGRFLGQWLATLAREKVANVIARAEHGGIALQHHHTHGLVGRSAAQRFGQRRIHGLGDGVFLVHTVEGNGAYTGFGVHQDVLVSGFCHRFS